MIISSTIQLPSYSEYQTSDRVWIPATDGDQALFMVRIPPELASLDFPMYLELMKVRVEWMCRQWLEQNGQVGSLQGELERTLQQLNPYLMAPLLYQKEDTDEIGDWLMNWAVNLVEFDGTWLSWWQMTNGAIEFPIQLTELQPHPNHMAQHDAVTISQFLSELRTPFP
jgi:hypothetical protein